MKTRPSTIREVQSLHLQKPVWHRKASMEDYRLKDFAGLIVIKDGYIIDGLSRISQPAYGDEQVILCELEDEDEKKIYEDINDNTLTKADRYLLQGVIIPTKDEEYLDSIKDDLSEHEIERTSALYEIYKKTELFQLGASYLLPYLYEGYVSDANYDLMVCYEVMRQIAGYDEPVYDVRQGISFNEYIASKMPDERRIRELLYGNTYEKVKNSILKYLLIKYEQQAHNFSGEGYTIEHIMPQDQTYWKEKGVNVHQLGNLTLTRWNAKLGNKTFQEKKGIYESEFLYLNKEIYAREYWTKQAIQTRTTELVEFIITRYGRYMSKTEKVSELRIGEEVYPIKSTSQAVYLTVEHLIANYPHLVHGLEDEFSFITSTEKAGYKKLSTGMFCNTYGTSEANRRKIEKLIQYMGIDKANYNVE